MIHLITYGNHTFERSKYRLYKEANNVGWFDTITVYGLKDLDNNFKNHFKNILQQPRVGGYWIWKYYVIKKT